MALTGEWVGEVSGIGREMVEESSAGEVLFDSDQLEKNAKRTSSSFSCYPLFSILVLLDAAKDDYTSSWILLAAILGIASVGSYITSFGKMVLDLATPGKSLNSYGAKRGAWAVVTGCTSGIGREFAFQLSKAGFKLVLVARNEQALNALQKELKTESQIHVIDFSSATASDYKSLQSKLSSMGAIGVLVNNVGLGHGMPVTFQECPESEMENILEINCRATMRITKIVIPSMIRARGGLILNIGSFASLTSSPLLAVYAGTKAFLYTWSQALGCELADAQVDVSLVDAYFIVSDLSKIRKSNWLVPMPKAFV
ncbi:MAG: hypothetical protein CYPHOPRED_004262, partial [Cyphobasidiales sp. Tagirdzhanova-0007]